ncbi:MAG: 7-cyano-7-deazaguanine synthase [Acidobacteria bacterium]|nr:MAG: 7-cyano-7-deazaguanine synthase [Acidobacteriota bacterium]
MPRTAVLFSGGLDSAVLLARELEGHEAQRGTQPIHVRSGLAWEPAEARAIERILAVPPFAGRVAPVITLTVDMREVYPPTHWAVAGTPPAYDTPDEDVYLEGRNIVLISKAAVLCARLKIERLALGPLAGNPFPDATPEFFAAISKAMSLGLGRPLSVVAPLASMHKEDVIRLGQSMGVPLELTLSCMNPQPGDLACGRCSKCRERDQAFSNL